MVNFAQTSHHCKRNSFCFESNCSLVLLLLFAYFLKNLRSILYFYSSFSEHVHSGYECNAPNMPDDFKKCKGIVASWGVGGDPFYFPPEAGYPVGEEHGGATYYMLEVHYDNPGNFDSNTFPMKDIFFEMCRKICHLLSSGYYTTVRFSQLSICGKICFTCT